MSHMTENDIAPLTTAETGVFFKILLENTFDGVSVIDFDGTVRYYSPSVRRILGYDPVEGVGKNFFELVHPDDKHKCSAALEKLIAQPGTPISNTVRFKHEDGSWKYIEAQAINLRDDPRVAGILINFREITERLLMQQSLAESEERYRSLIENSFDGITVINFDGIVKYHSPSLLRILGYRPQSGIGKSILQLLHPDDLKIFLLAQQDLTKHKDRTFNATVRFKHKNESWVALEVRAINLMDKQGIEGFLINYRDITKSKTMERALQQSEEFYRKMVETAPEAIFIFDAEKCKFIDFNENALKLFKYSREQMLNMSAIDVCPPVQPGGKSSQELAKEKIQEALAGGKPVYELQYKDAKGRLFTCEERIVRFPPYDRKLILGTAVDITERKKMKQALHESEERYRNMVENAQETIFVIDAETNKIIDFNENAVKLFGYSRAQLMNRNINDLGPPVQPDGQGSIDKGIEMAREALRKGKVFFEWIHRKANGKTFPSEVYLSRFPPFDRKLLRGTVIDVTAKKELEKKLRQHELEYSHLASVSPVGIFRTDAHGKSTYINEKWREIAGIPASQAMGTGWLKAIHPNDRSRVWKEWRTAFKKRKISRAEFRFLSPDGKITWVYGQAVPDRDEKGNITGYVGSVTDITGRKKAEEELQETNEKLKALYQRLETVREEEKKNIAMEIHDELGQELTALKLGMFWLQQELDKNRQMPAIAPARHKVKALIKLSNQTIASARKLAHGLRPMVLDNLGLLPAIEWLVNSVNENGKTRCSFTHDIREIKFRQEFTVALFRIIQESLTNIIRHSRSANASIGLFSRNNYLLLTFDDDGIGINPKNINQPDKLGLFGIKEKVASWNGVFKMESSHKKGTFMAMKFPLTGIMAKGKKQVQ